VKRLLLLTALLAGCVDDIDEEWQLDHDRIIAVRATPPHIVSGERAVLDMLVGRKGDHPLETAPAGAMVVSPESLADLLTVDSQGWGVTAPLEDRLAAARTELGLAADAPVPLVVGVGVTDASFPSGAGPFAATKTVWLGDSAQNPTLDGVTIDGAPPPAEIVVGKEVDVRLSVPFADPDRVRWMTSCGTMHDFDLPDAYLRVELDDPTAGDFAVVVRATDGGVAWRVWPIHAE
jgi:hypothetical protein